MPPDFRFTRFASLFMLLMAAVQYLSAQYTKDDFVRYTVKDGLSDNNVTCIQQDDWGFIWVGTEIGLNRFDGYQFKNYYQGLPEKVMSSSNIRRLIPLSGHRLAIVSYNGAQVLQTNDFSIKNYSITDSTSFVTLRNNVWDLKELDDGSIAITTSSGFYVFNKEDTLVFRHDAYGVSDIGNKRIFYGRDIFSLSANELLIFVEENELVHYTIDQRIFDPISILEHEWKSFQHPPETDGGPWISKAQISDHEFIFLPRKDSLIYFNDQLNRRVVSPLPFHWLDELSWESKVTMLDDSTFVINGRYTGFYFFHLDQRNGIIRCDPHKFLGNYKINTLFQDKDKRLWAGTTEGLLYQTINHGFVDTFHWPVDDNSNSGYADGLLYKNKLYLCRYSRDVGLVIIDTTSMQIEQEIHFYGRDTISNEIFSVQMYYKDTLWLGSSAGLLWFDTRTYQYGKVADLLHSTSGIPALMMLKPARPDGYAWMSGYLTGVAARFHIQSRTFDFFSPDSKPELPFSKLKNIAYDAFGDVWFSGHSLARWNNKVEYFDTLITVYGGPNKYNDDILLCVADEKGSLWMHNAENGLLEYQIKDKAFVSYTMKDGLPSDVLRCFSPVIDHTIWMGSHNHLTQMDTRTHKMEVYGYQDGIPELKPISRMMVLDTVKKRLYMFYKDEVIRFPIHPPAYTDLSSDLILQEVVINNTQSFSYPNQPLHLNPGDNNLTFHFTIIDFGRNRNYQFAYRLHEGDEWVSLGQQRSINLNNLSSGAYVLQLRSIGKSGNEKYKSFSFFIAPPFWKTFWFIALCMLAIAGIGYYIYRWRITQYQQKANLDRLLAQTEMKALHAQMNPHFIFNSLNSIREMILNNENHEASKFLSKFAHLIRITLDQSRQSTISLRNSMDYISRYVEMEKIRSSNFQFSMHADPALEPDETVLPPMLIQPFIENAIWHGTNGDGKMIDIKVLFQKSENQVVCIIEDNGVGIDHSLKSKNSGDQHQSVGIANIKNRIALLNQKYGMESTIIVVDKGKSEYAATSGTLVTISLPLEMIAE
ncbi:MAG: histidine kinase [Saprospiraceae bacterium]|nr:histidine kinase [Candidatus Opimibacter iunctus]